MMEKYLIIWEEAKAHLENLISEINSNILIENQKADELQKKINDIRENLRYLEYDEKPSELENMNRLRDKRDVLTNDVENIIRFAKSPYFAKVSCDEDKEIFISKIKSIPEKHIYLYTSPLATLRFKNIGEEASIWNEKYRIKDRDKYKIENYKLISLSHIDSIDSFEYDGRNTKKISIPRDIPVKNNTDEEKAQNDKNGLAGTRNVPTNKPNGLKSITELMREEQDKVMRAPIKGVTLITGSAGSGKTNIAIYRIKYLLEEYSNEFKKDNIGVFCFNVSLKKYLMNLFDELELDKSNVFSYDEWLRDILINYTNIKFINYSSGNDEFKYKIMRKEITNIIDDFLTAKKKRIMNLIIKDQYLSRYNSQFSDNENNYFTINDFSAFRKQIENQLSIKEKTCKNIFEYLAEKLNFKNNKEDKTNNNKELLKIIDERLGNIIKSEYCSEWDWERQNYKIDGLKLLNQLYSFDKFKYYIGNNIFKNYANTAIDSYDSYLLGYILSLICKDIFNKRYKLFDHIAVDEVQDFTPVQINLLFNICNNSLTLAGDITQKIFGAGIMNWSDLGLKIDNRYNLNMTHRASFETILYANAILKESSNNSKAEFVGKHGPKPAVVVCRKQQLINHVIEQIEKIKNDNPESSVVVVAPIQNMLNSLHNQLKYNGIDSYIALKDRWEFSDKVAVSTYYQIKGLEFDYVIILGLNFYENSNLKNKENVLYTVITRAKERTLIFCEDEMPKLISNINPSFYETTVD